MTAIESLGLVDFSLSSSLKTHVINIVLFLIHQERRKEN